MGAQKAVLIALLLAGAFAPTAAQKIGHVDKQQLLLQMPQLASAQERLRTKQSELEQRIKAMDTELTAAIEAGRAKADSMTAAERSMAERDIRQMAERAQAARAQANEDLEVLEQELISPLLAQIDTAITQVAEEEGFTYILDTGTGAAIYFAGGSDIAPLVKARLGIATP